MPGSCIYMHDDQRRVLKTRGSTTCLRRRFTTRTSSSCLMVLLVTGGAPSSSYSKVQLWLLMHTGYDPIFTPTSGVCLDAKSQVAQGQDWTSSVWNEFSADGPSLLTFCRPPSNLPNIIHGSSHDEYYPRNKLPTPPPRRWSAHFGLSGRQKLYLGDMLPLFNVVQDDDHIHAQPRVEIRWWNMFPLPFAPIHSIPCSVTPFGGRI